MTSQAWMLIVFFTLALFILAWPVGKVIDVVLNGRFRLGNVMEKPFYRLLGIDPRIETGWISYCIGLVVFNLLGLLLVFVIQKFQPYLPFNPQEFPGVSTDSSLNTAVSFVTNTNWQGYSGESTMSYFTR